MRGDGKGWKRGRAEQEDKREWKRVKPQIKMMKEDERGWKRVKEDERGKIIWKKIYYNDR